MHEIRVRYQNAPIATTTYTHWGASWAWQETLMSTYWEDGQKYLSGSVAGLGLTYSGTVTTGDQYMQITYHITGTESHSDTLGGIMFAVELDKPPLSDWNADTTLYGKTGWTISGGGHLVDFNFSPAIEQLYWEVNDHKQVRCILVSGDLTPGYSRDYTLTITLPQSGQPVLSPEERYPAADTSSWYYDVFSPTEYPVDLSFLNAAHTPAGTGGHVYASGDKFYLPNGDPIKFWACNVQAYALTSPSDAIYSHAERIAKMGFNLVRLHHHDSNNWVEPCVIDPNYSDTHHLDPTGLSGIDTWIKALQDNGIYVWLDVYVGRRFKSGDNVSGWDDINDRDGDVRGFNFVNESVTDSMKLFASGYLNHVNPYTSKAYKEDPAIMGMLVANEDDIIHHFGALYLSSYGYDYHHNLYDEKVTDFAARTSYSSEELWRTWENGPAKLLLSDVEYAWYSGMVSHMTGLGVQSLIAPGNSWGFMELFGLPSLCAPGDIVDVHSYAQPEFLSTNPKYRADYRTWASSCKVPDKPLAWSEWNMEQFPGIDRFTCPLATATFSSFHEIGAPMVYGYAQLNLGSDGVGNWSASL